LNSIGEKEIRTALVRRLVSTNEHEPDTLILEEFGVFRGAARLDVAVLNGRLHGFEIKSDFDTLRRLPRQMTRFAGVCEQLTLVTGPERYDAVLATVPSWCGLLVAVRRSFGIDFLVDRPAVTRSADPSATVKLLWNREAESLLAKYGYAGRRPRNRTDLCAAVLSVAPQQILRTDVLRILRQRASWRPVRQRTSGGD
jgi:hypothetical protein